MLLPGFVKVANIPRFFQYLVLLATVNPHAIKYIFIFTELHTEYDISFEQLLFFMFG
jgi:hypothetical protein